MRKILVLYIVFWSCFFSTYAQDRLTLDDAISKALTHNFDIRELQLAVEQADVNNTLGNAGFLPNVNASGNYNISSTNSKILFADGREQVRNGAGSQNYGGGVNVDYRIFAGGRAYVVKQQLDELQTLSEQQLQLQIQTTISQVIQAYAQTVFQHQQTMAIDTGLALAKTRMVLSRINYESGLSAKVDYLQARTDYNARQSDSLNIISTINGAFADLNLLMGEEPYKTYIVDDSLTLNMQLQPQQKELLYNNNLSINIAKRNWKIAELNADIAKKNMLPTIDLTAGYNYNKTRSEAGFALFNQGFGPSAGAVLNIPVFQGGNLRRIKKIEGLQAMRNEILYEKQTTEIGRQYRRAWADYKLSIAAYRLEKENINYAKENVDIQRARFRVGIATNIETREAENSYVQALIRLYTAAYNLKINETKVLELENELVQ